MVLPTNEAAKTVRENIARSKASLRRDDLPRALKIIADSLDIYSQIKVIGPLRYEIEVNLDEQLADICHHTTIMTMLPPGPPGRPFILRYIRGKEKMISTALRGLAGILEQKKTDAAKEEVLKKERRKQAYLAKGQELLDAGDTPRARAVLRRVADEFGKEKGIYLDIAERYRKANLPMEAAEMYELCMAEFPKTSSAWSGAIAMYRAMQEFEKVEKLYLRVLQQFGAHPLTLCNIAQFYLDWRKKDKAAEFAIRALQRDPNMAQAKAILQASEGH